jgi:hypothetical protein
MVDEFEVIHAVVARLTSILAVGAVLADVVGRVGRVAADVVTLGTLVVLLSVQTAHLQDTRYKDTTLTSVYDKHTKH